ncbi:MAG: hypothetical protein JSS79_18055 [Bacteroidetes bacterium]|nr:hypothetical protein [Bacteroidota bacterium]
MSTSNHTFHIPVMGLAFTIDSPIKVARFGISSVISIVEDNLIEKMRQYYYGQRNEPYTPITNKMHDHRARRITDYLNLVHRIVKDQLQEMTKQSFEKGSELSKYFEMLPSHHSLHRLFKTMMSTDAAPQKVTIGNYLRQQVKPGSIDANIMTKLDRNQVDENGNTVPNSSDALSALRGYANSTLDNSSIVLSAGMNPRLFNYMETLPSFDRNENGEFGKKIIIKVSDYRSAYIQGKVLAKKGLWVSEFRIESGLNCGGHAFATDGLLIGPILEEFKNKRNSLVQELFGLYNRALAEKGRRCHPSAPALSISFQGGIGTADEDEFLRNYYGIDSTGWGTPFLLVPEATTVDNPTLNLLSKATEADIFLSKNSPLGIRFHYLRGTSAENEKFNRIEKKRPGSPCTEKYLESNTEFTTEPICTASRKYQERKIAQLQSLDLPQEEYKRQVQEVLAKECLCIGLSNAAVNKYHLKPFKKLDAVNICPGPNIAYFSKILSLQEMVNHIYGKINVITHKSRPSIFIKELSLYLDYLKEMIAKARQAVDEKNEKQIQTFQKNISEGVAYYKDLLGKMDNQKIELAAKLQEGLDELENQILKPIFWFCDAASTLK